MPKLKVYRVELPDTRRGPYIDAGPTYAVPGLKWHDDSPLHPGPPGSWCDWADKVVRGSSDDFTDERYGFVSKKQLKSWFNRTERALLSEAGWVVGEYHVPKRGVMECRRQATFDLPLAHHVCDLDPATMRRAS